MQTEQGQVEDAQRTLRGDYYADVRSVAEGLKRRIDDGEFEDREQFLDVLHETIDGDQRVIITWQAMLGVVFSSQDSNLAIDEFGTDCIDFSEGIPWSKLMFPIFHRDVMEMLETLGVDVNDPIPSTDTEGGA